MTLAIADLSLIYHSMSDASVDEETGSAVVSINRPTWERWEQILDAISQELDQARIVDPDGSWGTWEEDRRYPSKDGTRLIVVSKRVDGAGKIHWKNERRPLSPARTVPTPVPTPARK